MEEHFDDNYIVGNFTGVILEQNNITHMEGQFHGLIDTSKRKGSLTSGFAINASANGTIRYLEKEVNDVYNLKCHFSGAMIGEKIEINPLPLFILFIAFVSCLIILIILYPRSMVDVVQKLLVFFFFVAFFSLGGELAMHKFNEISYYDIENYLETGVNFVIPWYQSVEETIFSILLIVCLSIAVVLFDKNLKKLELPLGVPSFRDTAIIFSKVLYYLALLITIFTTFQIILFIFSHSGFINWIVLSSLLLFLRGNLFLCLFVILFFTLSVLIGLYLQTYLNEKFLFSVDVEYKNIYKKIEGTFKKYSKILYSTIPLILVFSISMAVFEYDISSIMYMVLFYFVLLLFYLTYNALKIEIENEYFKPKFMSYRKREKTIVLFSISVTIFLIIGCISALPSLAELFAASLPAVKLSIASSIRGLVILLPTIIVAIIFVFLYGILIPWLFIAGKRKVVLSILSFVLFVLVFKSLEWVNEKAELWGKTRLTEFSLAGIPAFAIFLGLIIAVVEYTVDRKKDRLLEQKFGAVNRCSRCSKRILEENPTYCPFCGAVIPEEKNNS